MRNAAAMCDGEDPLESRPVGAARSPRARGVPSRIGLVVHPSRAVERPLRELRQWAGQHSVDLVQIPAFCAQQQVAAHGIANDCDLVVSIGQVVPHEVIGMANFTKNLVIGLGGAATIDRRTPRS